MLRRKGTPCQVVLGSEAIHGWHTCCKCGKRLHVHAVAATLLEEPFRSAMFHCNLNADIWCNCCEDAEQSSQRIGTADGTKPPCQLPQPLGKDEAVLGSGSHVLGAHCVDSNQGTMMSSIKRGMHAQPPPAQLAHVGFEQACLVCCEYESTRDNIMTVCDRCLLHGLHGQCKKQYAEFVGVRARATGHTPAHHLPITRYERDRDCPPGMRTLPLPTGDTDSWLCKHCLHQRHALASVQDPPNWPIGIVRVLQCRPGESLDASAIWACIKEAKWSLSFGLGDHQGRALVLSTCLKLFRNPDSRAWSAASLMPLIAPSWQLSIAQPVDTIPGDQAQATGPARRGRTRSGRVAPAIVQPAATPKAAKGRQVDDATWSMVLQHIVFKGYRPWFSDMWSYQLSPAQPSGFPTVLTKQDMCIMVPDWSLYPRTTYPEIHDKSPPWRFALQVCNPTSPCNANCPCATQQRTTTISSANMQHGANNQQASGATSVKDAIRRVVAPCTPPCSKTGAPVPPRQLATQRSRAAPLLPERDAPRAHKESTTHQPTDGTPLVSSPPAADPPQPMPCREVVDLTGSPEPLSPDPSPSMLPKLPPRKRPKLGGAVLENKNERPLRDMRNTDAAPAKKVVEPTRNGNRASALLGKVLASSPSHQQSMAPSYMIMPVGGDNLRALQTQLSSVQQQQQQSWSQAVSLPAATVPAVPVMCASNTRVGLASADKQLEGTLQVLGRCMDRALQGAEGACPQFRAGVEYALRLVATNMAQHVGILGRRDQ